MTANATSESDLTGFDLSLDRDGNAIFVWSESGAAIAQGVGARSFDRWGNLLTNDFRVADVPNGSAKQATNAMSPDGEFIIAWCESTIGTGLFTQR